MKLMNINSESGSALMVHRYDCSALMDLVAELYMRGDTAPDDASVTTLVLPIVSFMFKYVSGL